MRPIDADSLKVRLSGCMILMPNGEKCTAKRAIDTQGTIEPEVRHGRWIEESTNEYYCSCCGKYAPIAKNMRHCDCSKWCKECGTKMDGGADNG